MSPGQQKEVGWLTRELHDTVLQDLLYIGMELSDLIPRLPSDLTDVSERLKVVEKSANDSYQGLRMILGLAEEEPAGGEPRNLEEEVRRSTAEFEARSNTKVTLQIESLDRPTQISDYTAQQVKAILREALWNAWLHGKGKEAKVVVRKEKEGILVSVADGGPGFDPSRYKKGHYGLRIMRERARAIKGKLHITSAPGQGTLVSLYFPWKNTPN
jgi:two-component system nitrate/nitrite sensor histidine kinase NarX